MFYKFTGSKYNSFSFISARKTLNYYDELYRVSRKGLCNILLLISVNVLAQDSGKKIPFSLVNNHIYIQGILNDSLPVWILLDCGARSIISEGQAKKGKIKTHSPGQADGIGNSLVPYHMTDSASLTMANIRYTEKRIPVLSLTEVEDCGARITVDKEPVRKQVRKQFVLLIDITHQ